jgi:hypothetical protein
LEKDREDRLKKKKKKCSITYRQEERNILHTDEGVLTRIVTSQHVIEGRQEERQKR